MEMAKEISEADACETGRVDAGGMRRKFELEAARRVGLLLSA